MARQTGVVTVTGAIGNVVGYKKDGKNLLKIRTGPSLKQIREGENFTNLRKHQQEFKRASKWCKALREAANRTIFNSCLQSKVMSLTLCMKKNITMDKVNMLGERDLQCEHLDLQLQGFEFGDYKSFNASFMRFQDVEFNQATQLHDFSFGRHVSQDDVNFPNGATHYSFAACLITCSNDSFKFEVSEIRESIIDRRSAIVGNVPKIILSVPTPPNAVGSLRIYVAGVHFWQKDVAGNWIPYFNGRNNAARVVKIEI